MNYWTHNTLKLILSFICLVVSAAYAQDPNTENPVHINLTTGDLKLEVEGLDTTLAVAKESLTRVTASLQRLSEREDLSPEERQLMREVVTELSKSVNKVADAANNLPESIKNSQQPIQAIADEFMASVRTTMMLGLLGVLILLAVVLLLVYHYVLKPVTVIAKNMESISNSVEKTVVAAKDGSNGG